MEQDLIDLLVDDHRRIESLFAEIETAPDPTVRRATLDEAVTALARHTTAEAAYLQPALREHLPAGPDIAAYEADEHRRTDELLERLTRLNDIDPAFDELLAALLDAVRQHMQEEETELSPRLCAACPADTLLDLGTALRTSH